LGWVNAQSNIGNSLASQAILVGLFVSYIPYDFEEYQVGKKKKNRKIIFHVLHFKKKKKKKNSILGLVNKSWICINSYNFEYLGN